MFERYTERARQTLFCARDEAVQRGSASIETEHVLLGLMRESKGFASQMFERSHVSLEGVRKHIDGRGTGHEKVSNSVEMPFSPETIRVLQSAANEADRLSHRHIGTEHLLLGILCEPDCFAAAPLLAAGMTLQSVRGEIAQLGDIRPDAS